MNQDLKYMVGAVKHIDRGLKLEGFECHIPQPLRGHVSLDIPMQDPDCKAAMRQLLVALITHTQTEAAELCPPEPPAEKVQ